MPVCACLVCLPAFAVCYSTLCISSPRFVVFIRRVAHVQRTSFFNTCASACVCVCGSSDSPTGKILSFVSFQQKKLILALLLLLLLMLLLLLLCYCCCCLYRLLWARISSIPHELCEGWRAVSVRSPSTTWMDDAACVASDSIWVTF